MVAIIYMYDVPPHWDEETIGLLLNKTTTTTTKLVNDNNELQQEEEESRLLWNVIRIRHDAPPLCKEVAQIKLIFPTFHELVSCISKYQSLIIPMTHGYHYFSFSYNETIYEPFQHPPSTYLQDVPLHLQLMALSTKELQTRINKHTLQQQQQQHQTKEKNNNDASSSSLLIQHTKKRKRRGGSGRCCKVTHHAKLAKQLGILLGGVRTVIPIQGVPIQTKYTIPLLQYLQSNTTTLWPTKEKQRKGVYSSHYLTVRQKHPKEHDEIWNLCQTLIQSTQSTQKNTTADANNEMKYTALAITKNFRGSPHTDFHDTTYQHVIALGNFIGGRLCVESDDDEVVSINIQNRLGRMDGRRVHWVTGFQGERYSVVYYSTNPNHFTPTVHQSNHNQWIQTQTCKNLI